MPDKQPPVPPPKPKMAIVQKDEVKTEQFKAKEEIKPNLEAKPKEGIKEEAKPKVQPKIKPEKPKNEAKQKESSKKEDEPKPKEQSNKQKEQPKAKESAKTNEAKEESEVIEQPNASTSISSLNSPPISAKDGQQQNEQDAKAQERQQQLKSLDALYAAAREEFDLDLSPTESAIKTLKEGREMQKLSVVRNLAELIEAEPAEAMQKVLPQIQDLLNVEPSNLDMHCEGAVVYKNCIKDQKLQRLWPELPEQLLSAILENIERQKENVTAAAWLESLVDIADCVPQQCVVSMIVPVAIAQADSVRRVQRRVISTRLIERLATLVPREIVQRELSPCAQMLCQDPSTAVRTSIAQRLSVLAQALNNSTDCCALLLPCIIELCKDEDSAVREAILGSLDVCLPYFNKDAKKTVLLPLLRKCSEQALILRNTSLSVIARHFGSWLQCMRDMLAQNDLRWWLDTYTRILDFANQQMPSSDEKDQKIGQNTAAKNAANNEQLRTACRRMCAYNFPCIVAMFGDDQTMFTDKLMPILERFCRDPDEEVRSTVASGFHQILTHRKNCTSSKSTNEQEQPQLLNPFVELLSSGSGDVVQQLTGNLQQILPILYKDINATGNNKKMNAILTKLNQILVSCNSLLRGSGSWRAHEAYLNSLSVLRQLVRPMVIKQSFLPLLKQEVLTVRALPCRVAAAQSLLLLMRELPMAKDRQAIIDFFVKEIGQHQSCYRRRLLLDIVPPLLQHFSREFFIEKFLHAVLKLATDPISNIRLQLCRTLPIIKKYLLFPNDDPCLSSLERVVRDLLASEQNPLSRQLIQQSACELSRAETDQKESRANRAKLTEEKRLWTERDDDEEAEQAAKKEKSKKVQEKPKLEGPGSPESGIFFEDDNTSWSPQKSPRGLVRSATTANVPEIQLHSKSAGVTPSSSTDTIAAMAIERPSSSSSTTKSSHSNTMHSYGGTRSRKPPAPPSSSSTSTPSWRNTRPASAAPKLAIVRPQPQVSVTQRSCSPMPPAMADRKGASVEACDKNGSSATARNSKLPLSTARYRCGVVPNPGAQVQQLASKFMGPSNDGTEPVTESLKLKKYKPKEIFGQGTTSWSKTPQRMLQQSSTSNHSPSRKSAASEGRSNSPSSAMTRSSSAAPERNGPIPLQTSASSSSLNGRRPYGLMRVQSTSSAVERKPAQIRCHVVSMT